MGKNNRVTADLQINAKAHLTNSRNFINQLEKITEEFNFGDKIDSQLISAKAQLKDLNKILEKVQTKSIISNEDLKALEKAGKDITSLISKTEKLYNNFSSAELQKFSRAYIAQVKAQEEAVLKIKQEYQQKTGKEYDKEIKNLDKYKEQIAEVRSQLESLEKAKTTKTRDAINKENAKLQDQFDLLKKIQKTQNELAASRNDIYTKSSASSGFSEKELKSKVSQDKDDIITDVANQEYKNLLNIFQAISREKEEILKTTNDTLAAEKALIQLANKYSLANVNTTEEFEEQFRVLEKQKNYYRTLDNRRQLATVEKVTAEEERRNRLLEEQKRIVDQINLAQNKILKDNDFKSLNQMNAQKRNATAVLDSTNIIKTETSATLNAEGENDISTPIVDAIEKSQKALTTEEKALQGQVDTLNEYEAKVATQTERAADENDIKAGADRQINATNADGEKTRSEFKQSFEGLTQQDKAKIKGASTQGKSDFGNFAMDSIFPAGGQISVEEWEKSATRKTNDDYDLQRIKIDSLMNKLEKTTDVNSQKEIMEQLKAEYDSLNQLGNVLLRNALGEIDKNVEAAKAELLTYKYKNAPDDKPRYKVRHRERVEQLRSFIGGAEVTKSKIKEAKARAEAENNTQRRFLTEKIENINLGKLASETKEAKNQFVSFDKAVNQSGEGLSKAAQHTAYMGTVLDDFKNKVGYFLSLNYAIDFVTRSIRSASKYITELDKDMVQIGLVLEQTSDKVWKSYNTYANMAERLSTTTSDVTAAMKLFYQQGLNTVEVNKMVEASAIAAALGESTMAEASETLTSIINSYNLSANDAITVTDKISQVAIVSAADFTELSTAIEKVASSAASAGLDLDHMMGYLGKMIETTREAPTNIGTALKTIVANFSQFKEDPTAELEDGADINKADKALKSIGIQLLDSSGEMRDLGVVIDELGVKWNDLTRNQKAYLATTIAGTRQQSRFYALMNDYDRTLELVEEATDSTGKSTEQFALYEDSLTGATARLKNQVEVFYGKLSQGDGLLKSLANAGTELLKVINTLGPKTSMLAGLLGLQGARKGLNLLDEYKNRIKSTLDTVMSAQGLTERAQGSNTVNSIIGQQQFGILGTSKIGQKAAGFKAKQSGLQEDVTQLQNLLQVQTLLKDETVAYDDVLKQQIESLGLASLNTEALAGMNKQEAAAEVASAIATTGDSVAKKGATAATWGLVAANVALTMGVALIGVAIGALVTAITAWANAENKATENAQERLKAQQEEVKTLQGLSDTYNKLNKMVALSEEEHAELANTIAELGELYPELVAQYDAEGKAIALVNEELAKKLQLEKQAEVDAARGSIKATLGNSDKELDAYRYHSGMESGEGADWKFEELGIVLGENETFNYYVKHTDLENAFGEKSKAAFENQQQQIDNLVARGKEFDLKGANTAQNSLDWMNMIDVLQNYAANNITTEHALTLIDAFEKESKRLAKDDTNIDALEEYYDEVRSFVQKSNTEIANANKADFTALATDYSNATINASGLTTQKMGYAKTAINSMLKSKSLEMNDKQFKNYVYEDKQFQADVDKVIEEMRNMTSGQLKYYEDFMTSYASGTQTTAELQQSYDKIKEKIPQTLQTIIESNLDAYDDYLDDFKSKVSDDAEVNEGFSQLRKNLGQKMLEGYDATLQDLEDNEKGQEKFKEKYLELMTNEQFIKDFNKLDGTDLAEVQAFKDKYRTSLGNYGLDFFNTILENPEYDAEKTSEALNNALELMRGTGETASGSNMEDIASGQSQEGAFNILSSTDETRAQNTLLVGKKLMVSAEEISDSYEKAYKDISNYTTQIMAQAEQKIQDNVNTIRNTLNNDDWEIGDKVDYSALTEAEKETVKNAEEAIRKLKKQGQTAEELLKAYEKLDAAQQANVDFAPFRDGTIAIQSTVDELSNLASIYEKVKKGSYGYLELINWIANDTSGQLLAALEVENGQLSLNANAMEILAEAKRDEAIDTINGLIAKAEGQLYYLENVDTCTEAELADIKSIDDAQAKLNANTATAYSNMGTNVANFVTNFGTNAKKILKNVKDLILGFLKLNKAEAGENTDANVDTTADAGVTTEGETDETDTIDIEGRKKTLKENIERLKALRDNFKKMSGDDLLKGINDLNGGGDSGGGDEYEGMIEKLEHFYNYLRQIEALEAKINKIRERRNLIDATENYYIDDLIEENKLLKEQATLYGNYINDEMEYLAQLRNQLSATYGDWVYFNDEGVVQVKQTEFAINSEEEEERYNAFSELLEEYQNEYNTMLENQNTLYTIQATIVENINSSYDKILKRITDVADQLEYINSISEHWVEMSFGSIEKLPLLNDQIKTTADMLLNAQKGVNELNGDFDKLNKTIQNSDFTSLLTWDEEMGHYKVNNKAMADPKVRAQFEAQGYNWAEVETWVNATAAASQKITASVKETNTELMDARAQLKDLLEERISTITEIFEKATEEINKFYGIYEKKIEALGTENDLFGTKSENIDAQYDYLMTVAGHSKALLESLKKNNQDILNTLTTDYADYVQMIDGVAYINKMAIEESDTLTEAQKADLLQLYQLYYESQGQIEEVNEKFYDYISQIEELERAKRDAIIDLKNQLHDELIAKDQEEIDELSEKYDKMSALDDEYYSQLQQRISDARNARSRLQDQQDLAQMQNRLSVLQRDNSGQYNSELVELQKQINERLQAQADQNIDLEMERIAREQQQREEDRQMQITQMENLLTFKDENGIYWQETQDIINNGTASVLGILMSTKASEDQSNEARKQQLEDLQDQAEMANAGLSTQRGYLAADFRQALQDYVNTPLADLDIPGIALDNANTIANEIAHGTQVFINTMSGLFRLLNEANGKTEAGGYTTGLIDPETGVYTPPTKNPPKPPAPPPAPSTPSTPSKAVAVGGRVKANSGAKIYNSSSGSAGGNQYYSKDPIYTVLKILGNRALVRHHKLSSGYTGWFNLSDLTAYKKGGYVNFTGPAWVDGSNARPEAFLNAKQTALFETLRDALVRVPNINSKDTDNSENITIENLTIDVKELADTDSVDKIVRTVKQSIYKDATSGNNMKINRR